MHADLTHLHTVAALTLNAYSISCPGPGGHDHTFGSLKDIERLSHGHQRRCLPEIEVYFTFLGDGLPQVIFCGFVTDGGRAYHRSNHAPHAKTQIVIDTIAHSFRLSHVWPIAAPGYSSVGGRLTQKSQMKTAKKSSSRAVKASPAARRRSNRQAGPTKERPSHQRCGQRMPKFTSVSHLLPDKRLTIISQRGACHEVRIDVGKLTSHPASCTCGDKVPRLWWKTKTSPSLSLRKRQKNERTDEKDTAIDYPLCSHLPKISWNKTFVVFVRTFWTICQVKDKAPTSEPVVLEDAAADEEGNPLPRVVIPAPTEAVTGDIGDGRGNGKPDATDTPGQAVGTLFDSVPAACAHELLDGRLSQKLTNPATFLSRRKSASQVRDGPEKQRCGCSEKTEAFFLFIWVRLGVRAHTSDHFSIEPKLADESVRFFVSEG